MIRGKRSNFFLLFFLSGIFCACQSEDYLPKPKQYFRIDIPSHNYIPIVTQCPYFFELDSSAILQSSFHHMENTCWKDIRFPNFKATVHLSYKTIENNLTHLIEDCQELVYKHTIKAYDISEQMVYSKEKKVYGMAYGFEGKAATVYQFYLTDSTQHFVRGSLYYDFSPNYDSLRPVTHYLVEDMQHIIETFQWR